MSYASAALKWSDSASSGWRHERSTPNVSSSSRLRSADLMTPFYSAEKNAVEKRFHELAEQWKTETLDMSSLTDMICHPAYMQIIGMGEKALPFLFDELRTEPQYWFTALEAITQESDLIPQAAAGDLDEMTSIWLRWARQHGY